MLLKDLRVILRARGLNPAGSKETLEQILKEHMCVWKQAVMIHAAI